MNERVLWRIARRKHALDRSGEGAKRDGGRWNRAGTPVIYASTSVAIAALEKLVHLAGVMPADLVLVRIDLPRDVSTAKLAHKSLLQDWATLPPSPSTMQLGSTWVKRRRSLVLYVPSALVPEEQNAVLNPAHPDFAHVRFRISREFSYDTRIRSRAAGPRASRRELRSEAARSRATRPPSP